MNYQNYSFLKKENFKSVLKRETIFLSFKNFKDFQVDFDIDSEFDALVVDMLRMLDYLTCVFEILDNRNLPRRNNPLNDRYRNTCPTINQQ